MTTDPNAPPPQPKRKYKALIIISSLFALAGVLFWIYWIGIGQYRERTTDCYINGNMIMITPEISGLVTEILVDNTQMVKPGQPLIKLDRSDYLINYEKAKGELGDSVRFVRQMFIHVEQLEAKKMAVEADLLRAKLDYEHRKALVTDASVSREDFEHSETTLSAAFAKLDEVKKEILKAEANVVNTTITTHPKVELAKSVFKKAFLDLHRCTVRAPTHGIISFRKAQLGQWVQQTEALMSLVPLDQIWADANYREVSLKNIRIGQPVELVSDMYGSSVIFHGTVVGLNAGTGSVFSVLPPQNATGNWIKIVQRVPVKIELNPEELKVHPLVLGLSLTSKVDTHDRTGSRLPKTIESKPIYSSSVYKEELSGVNCLIDKIIKENSSGFDE